MIFYLFLIKNIKKKVIVELKNGLIVKGRLVSCDMFLNVKIDNIFVDDLKKFRGLEGTSLLSIRGSCIKYIKTKKDDNLVASLLNTSRNRFIVNSIKECSIEK